MPKHYMPPEAQESPGPVAIERDATLTPDPALVVAPGATQAPATQAGPALLTPEEWAKQKGIEPWQLAAARAYALASTDPVLRVPWLPNGRLAEQGFDAALDRALNATLR